MEKGYYDTPRRCSLTELAGELDVSKSTLSVVLHRAKGNGDNGVLRRIRLTSRV
ncbi:helix-turn-helix domain-containing protein [Haladaptatus sp. DYF46]|uniref:helix-turn-helix domain-containing protein n=1 Tax=Haladaptatus sp. DYF46 TaxID=2886041 RepID=UPI001E548D61